MKQNLVKYILFIMLIVINYYNTISQEYIQDYYSLEQTIYVKNEERKNVLFAIGNNKIFMIPKSFNLSNGQSVLKMKELISGKQIDLILSDSIFFIQSESQLVKSFEKNYDNNYSIIDFKIINDYMVIATYNLIFILKIKDVNFSCIKMYKLNEDFSSVHINGDYIELTEFYLRPDICTDCIKYTKINFIENTLEKQKLRKVSGLPFSYFGPKQIIATNNDFICYSDIDNFRINIINKKTNKIDTIIATHPIYWVYINKDSLANIYSKVASIDKNYVKNKIDILRPYLSVFSFVHRISIDNQNQITVIWSVPSPIKEIIYEYYYSIIEFVNDKWEIKNLSLKDSKIDLNQSIFDLKGRIPFGNDITINDNEVLLVLDIPIELTETIYKKPIIEIMKLADQFYLDNESNAFSVMLFEKNKGVK